MDTFKGMKAFVRKDTAEVVTGVELSKKKADDKEKADKAAAVAAEKAAAEKKKVRAAGGKKGDGGEGQVQRQALELFWTRRRCLDGVKVVGSRGSWSWGRAAGSGAIGPKKGAARRRSTGAD